MRGARRTAGACLSAFLLTSPLAAQADVQRCASQLTKAYGKMFDTIFALGVEACVAGSSGDPAPVDEDAIAEAVDEFNAALQEANDRYGEASCWRNPSDPVELAGAITIVESEADSWCLVDP